MGRWEKSLSCSLGKIPVSHFWRWTFLHAASEMGPYTPNSCVSPEPPAIAYSPSNVTLTSQTPAELPCEASGTPKPQVAWWKDRQQLDFRLQQGSYWYVPVWCGSSLVPHR